METKVLTQEEIQLLKNLQSNQNLLITSLGNLEYQIELLTLQRQSIKNEIKNQIEEETRLSKELNEKYGEGSIDLEKGEFTPIL
jgi:hypothetical protein